MKATKKIVGAACALVAAVALSAGSTFAWFSTTSKATATGLQVQTTVPTNLYIADGIKTAEAQFTASTVEYNDTATPIKPVTFDFASNTLTAKDATTFSSDPTVSDKGTATAYENIGTIKNESSGVGSESGKDITKYVYVKQMSLMNKGAASTADINLNVTVTATIPSDSKTIGFLKCGFLVKKDADNTDWKAMTDVGAGNADWTVNGTTATYTIASCISALKVNVAQAVTFVVWYEGNDTDCYSNNALQPETSSFSIDFSIAS